MKLTNLAVNIAIGFLMLIMLSADYVMVASTEAAVRNDCETRVAYDKSGTMFCVAVNTINKTVKVSQR